MNSAITAKGPRQWPLPLERLSVVNSRICLPPHPFTPCTCIKKDKKINKENNDSLS
jgi:hypothetical protein